MCGITHKCHAIYIAFIIQLNLKNLNSCPGSYSGPKWGNLPLKSAFYNFSTVRDTKMTYNTETVITCIWPF